MTRVATVRRVMSAGFRLHGPDADENCRQCPHVWGDHVLVPAFEDNPFKGGLLECPEPDCRCVGTWGVPNAPHQEGNSDA